MLLHFVKFTALIVLALLEVIFIDKPFLNAVAYIVIFMSVMLLITGFITPKRNY